jgi:hypothetical protein
MCPRQCVTEVGPERSLCDSRTASQA